MRVGLQPLDRIPRERAILQAMSVRVGVQDGSVISIHRATKFGNEIQNRVRKLIHTFVHMHLF
ncbi:citrate lyase alpha subunit [Hydrogenophaga laconesensis]|uniref:Citrate lyase alpha subunit n=1 Tax=Hydrogenophaga laconesensis TaxID=1805971 RepID=A0ABU1VAW0_9BURK|nr:citrate lyase alpha subunit [Hydrogenophaga laconesensis]